MANPFDSEPEPFSSRYCLVKNAEVRTWSDEEAHMDEGLYAYLARRYGEPVVGYVGGLHYAFKPSRQVLSNTAAIPERKHGSKRDPSALLIQK